MFKKKSLGLKRSTRSKRSKRSTRSKKPKSKTLNAYQKFVKKHSKDSAIRGLSPKSRMRAISKLWKKHKTK
jgi:hypothetical protein